MRPIKIKVRDNGEIIETLIAEDRGTGTDIRAERAAICDASISATVDLDVHHCDACGDSIADQLGLSDAEVDKIARWRKRKDPDHPISGKELGEILDKIVARLEEVGDCDADETRLVIEVEDV